MSIEREWTCRTCDKRWIADFEQTRCRCGSDEIVVEQPVTTVPPPHVALLKDHRLWKLADRIAFALRGAGCTVTKHRNTFGNSGVTPAMAIAAQLVVDGVLKVEG